jgi:hypothetical protein
VLLWTTSLSDPAWSDLGLGPWPALLHQGFLAQTWSGGVESRHVDTDSLLFIPSAWAFPDGADGGSGAHPSADKNPPRVIDPDGKPFTRLQPEAGGWMAGPFDRPGLYRLADSWFAANLATPPPTPTGSDWDAFREALGDSAWRRTTRISGSEGWRGLYGGIRLRLGLLLMTALLLFAEGIVSLRFSPSRN